MNRRATAAALLAALALGTAQAQTDTHPNNVVNLTANATLEVPKDLLTVTLAAVRDGADAASVQSALKQTLDAALGEARRAARPGDMEVRTGNFSLYPRYSQQGRIAGWQGQAELVLEGRDVSLVAQTAGRLAGMNVTQVVQGLSREALARHEGEVTQRAIAGYRAKAAEIARQFGFNSYVLREVHVSVGEPPRYPVPVMMRAKAEAAQDASPLPLEVGKGTITATVSGSVILK
ncbi:MAG TPA: SIMPL domain-containing protein [Burkholderiaceae bacterium]|nr:SIMPL domain-containing protein [Burkholderiaceae bacterium]